MNNLYKMNKFGIKQFVRENQFAKVATRNFLAAFGIYLYENEQFGMEKILEAFSAIDKIMARDDNIEKLEESVGIRLNVEG